MFASGTGSMRGPRVKTPLLLLLLLAALTKTVLCDDGDAAAVDEAGATDTLKEEAAEVVQEDPGADGGGGGTEISETIPTTTDDSPTAAPDPSLADENMLFPVESPIEDDHGSGLSLASLDDVPTDATPGPYSTGPGDISSQGGEEGLSLIIILIPVVLVVLIIGMIVCGIFINRRWNEKARNQELRKEDPYLDGSSTEKVPMPMFEEDVPSVLELEMEELDQWMKNDGETAKDSTLA